MYDFHTHSLLSDGVLLPSEIAMRYLKKGYKTIAITDHVDYSNIQKVVDGILRFTRHWPKDARIQVLPGIELTHLPLEQFRTLAKYARSQGIKIVVGHGETTVEPVMKGTNMAALEAGIDILAHPGLITDEQIKFAKEKGIFLEITARRGHCNTNNYVVKKALKLGAKLILNTDSHCPEDLLDTEQLKKVGSDAGLSELDLEKIFKDVREFIKDKKRGKR